MNTHATTATVEENNEEVINIYEITGDAKDVSEEEVQEHNEAIFARLPYFCPIERKIVNRIEPRWMPKRRSRNTPRKGTRMYIAEDPDEIDEDMEKYEKHMEKLAMMEECD
jgi:hypothetical protein